MHPEGRVQRVRERAYEIYRSRDPNESSPEEDWWRAEQEIEREEEIRVPSRMERARWSELTLTAHGKDIENPT
jgi:Protein of unknown function (DUF2934)